MNAANCSTVVSVDVTANPIPADATGITSSTSFCGCGVATLTVTLAPGSDVRWYDAATGGNLWEPVLHLMLLMPAVR
ncbi:MAG: hypothetical protein IPP46_09985 [Bacteroidetes bacterium]|nr:hypothetical protein [Bacteroidota bacterium]